MFASKGKSPYQSGELKIPKCRHLNVLSSAEQSSLFCLTVIVNEKKSCKTSATLGAILTRNDMAKQSCLLCS
jgi:hypothetical protein